MKFLLYQGPPEFIVMFHHHFLLLAKTSSREWLISQIRFLHQASYPLFSARCEQIPKLSASKSLTPSQCYSSTVLENRRPRLSASTTYFLRSPLTKLVTFSLSAIVVVESSCSKESPTIKVKQTLTILQNSKHKPKVLTSYTRKMYQSASKALSG